MRIHHHVSIILFVAIGGAIGLAVTVGVMLGGVERAARAAGMSAEQYSQVETVVAHGRDINMTVGSLTADSSTDAFAALTRDFQRSLVTLTKLRYSALLPDTSRVDEAMVALETIARQERRIAQRSAEGVVTPQELQRLRQGIGLYLQRLESVRADAEDHCRRRQRISRSGPGLHLSRHVQERDQPGHHGLNNASAWSLRPIAESA